MQFFTKIISAAVAATLVSLALPHTASAQSYGYAGYGAANISVANGSVAIIRADSGAQVAATQNAPVVTGDYIVTGNGSNAEVQFDGVSMLRLAPNTQVRMVNLSPGSREVQLAAGTVDLAQLQGTDGGEQLDTPQLSLRPNQSGDYRVTVLGNGETLVTVRSGAASVSSANGTQTLTPGGTLVAYGNSVSMQNPVGFDSFDQFNISRDQYAQSAYNSNPYLSPGLAGYSNLANYGQWQNVPGYGYAWAPNNQSQTGFAPYQNGQWVWEPGYGYTWVDNSPYGYTTSHYGTWFNNSNYGGWLWQPPAYGYQNSPTSLASAWLPAVVSFFLSGSNGSSLGSLGSLLGNFGGLLGSSNADIGWIPLAPGEPYQPWYGQNYSYPMTELTNVPNVTNVYTTYSNARYYRGITMIPVSSWRSGNFRRYVVPRPQQIRQIVVIRGAVPVVPTTQNLHYSTRRTVTQHVTLARSFSAPRLSAKAPAVSRISFAAQQSRIRTIITQRPKVAALPVRHAASHPVYHAPPRTPVHVIAIKPVAPHTTISAHHTTTRKPAEQTKPATRTKPATQTKPATRTKPATQAKPVTQTKPAAQAKPATQTRPATQAKPATHVKSAQPAKPVEHTKPPSQTSTTRVKSAPPAKPAERTPVPVRAAPMPVPPAQKPVEHPPVPQPHPAEPRPATPHPAAKPFEPHPVPAAHTHPAAAEHPTPKPTP